MKQHREIAASKSLSRLTGQPPSDPGVQSELDTIRAALQKEDEAGESTYRDCLRLTPNRIALRTLTSIVIQALQQLTGITFIFYCECLFLGRHRIIVTSCPFHRWNDILRQRRNPEPLPRQRHRQHRQHVYDGTRNMGCGSTRPPAAPALGRRPDVRLCVPGRHPRCHRIGARPRSAKGCHRSRMHLHRRICGYLGPARVGHRG